MNTYNKEWVVKHKIYDLVYVYEERLSIFYLKS